MAIEIVDLPSYREVIFHSYVTVYQRVIVAKNGEGWWWMEFASGVIHRWKPLNSPGASPASTVHWGPPKPSTIAWFHTKNRPKKSCSLKSWLLTLLVFDNDGDLPSDQFPILSPQHGWFSGTSATWLVRFLNLWIYVHLLSPEKNKPQN